ncbi:MAG: hypothetical protein AAFR35_16045 [Pseudomonadota bacterium]
MRLILHVGTHKTGTTLIQDSLFRHRADLERQGVHYSIPTGQLRVTKSAHHGLFRGLSRFGAAERAALESYRASALGSGAHTLVLSAESLMQSVDADERGTWEERRARYLARLAEYLAPFETEVIVYLRRPDSFAVSFFKERAARSTSPITFPEMVADLKRHYVYQPRIEDFRRAFPKVTVRSYEAASASGLIADFVEQTRIPTIPVSAGRSLRSGVSVRASHWLMTAKQYEELASPFRWRFALEANATHFADPRGTTFWSSDEERSRFYMAMVKDLDEASFWDGPGRGGQPIAYDAYDFAADEQAFKMWWSQNRSRQMARVHLGLMAFAEPLGVEVAQLAVLTQYYRLGIKGRAPEPQFA